MSPAAAASLKDICYSLVSAKVGITHVSLVEVSLQLSMLLVSMKTLQDSAAPHSDCIFAVKHWASTAGRSIRD